MIRRTYQCENCEQYFTIECNAADPDPFCPNPDCDKVLDWRPQKLTIGGSIEAKAADQTYRTLETDYGLSNFKDNAQAGESGIIRRQETKQETELVEREFREQISQMSPEKTAQFWGQNAGAATGMQSMTGKSLIEMAKVGPQGQNPMTQFQNAAVKAKVSRDPRSMISEGYRADMSNPARKRG
jgi:predicted DNA-binding WGR domain protein